MKLIFRSFNIILFLLLSLFTSHVSGSEIRVAVASNFLKPLKHIARIYEQETGERVFISSGSTGKLYAQIVNGAPYDVFLAANSREPQRLEKEGHASYGSRFTYARGRLVLWDPKGSYQYSTLEQVLKMADYKRLSLANPLTAPYGEAAFNVLKNIKMERIQQKKILRGENISQAFQYLASGAADIGFIALSQIRASGKKLPGHYWEVNENLHQDILQQAVLLTNARQKTQGKKFLNYLKSSKGQEMIETFGYGLL